MGLNEDLSKIMESQTPKPTLLSNAQTAISSVCDEVKSILLSKNLAYGNSALEPVRIFSKASTVEQINVRIDDKLSRLARGHAAGEDVELDLIGYLILKRVWRTMNANKPACEVAK